MSETWRRAAGRLAAGMIAVVAVVALVGSAEEESAKKSDSDGETEQPREFAIGDSVELGDYKMVVHGAQPLQPTNEFSKPAAGNVWIAVDVELTNLSDKATSMSTLMQFEVQDSANKAYDVAITGENLPSLDGEAPPGGSRRGTLVFEVPETSTGLRLNFAGDVFGSGSASVRLTP